MDPAAEPTRKRRALCVGLSVFGDYDGEPPTDSYAELPYAGERTAQLAESLTRLGFSCTTADYANLPTADALGEAVISAIDGGEDGDVQVVHVLSHGHMAPSSVYVVGADADYAAGTSVAAWVAHIEDFPHKPRPDTMFLLDICHAGAAARLEWLRAAGPSTRAWVIAATPGDGLAYDGRFSEAVANVFRQIHTGEIDFYPSEFVPFGHVVEHVRREMVHLGSQNQFVTSTPVDGIAAPPFFPNTRRPAANSSAIAWKTVDAATQPFADLDFGLDEAHFLDRATGHSGLGANIDVGFFTGREMQLEALTAWLEDTGAGSLRVVTGGPGSGKSALLGIIVCAIHPQLRDSTRRLWEHVPAAPRHTTDTLAAIHLRERSLTDALGSLISQLGLLVDDRDPAADDIIVAISALPSPPVIIMDALDEALTQHKIVQDLLLPLAAAVRPDGDDCCRLMVGMRPWEEFADLQQLAKQSGGLIDLDVVPADVLRVELGDYTQDLLSNAPLYAARRHLPIRRKVAQEVADALTEPGRERGGEFLAAALYTNWLLTEPPGAAVDPALRVPRSVPDILELDLATQADNRWLRAVLVTLAYAHGSGMPATVIRRIAPLFLSGSSGDGTRLTVAEFDLVLRRIRFYLRASPDVDGTTLYRLFHQSLADHLRADDADLGALVDHLLATAPVETDGTRRWDSAEPYVTRHAIQHAADAGRIDELLRVEPQVADRAFNAVKTRQGEVAAAIYRESSERFGFVDLEARRQLLGVNAARYGEDEVVARLLRAPGLPTPEWWPQWSTGGQMASNPLAVLTGHVDAVTAVVTSKANGRPLAITASSDTELRIWDLLTVKPTDHPIIHNICTISAVAVIQMPATPVVITGDTAGMLTMWDLETCEPLGSPFGGGGGAIEALTCTYLDEFPIAISNSRDGLNLWNLETREQVGTLTGPGMSLELMGAHIACTIVDEVPVVVACTHEGTVRVWDLQARELLFVLPEKQETEPGEISLYSPGASYQYIQAFPYPEEEASAGSDTDDGTLSPAGPYEPGPPNRPPGAQPSPAAWVNAMTCLTFNGQPVVILGNSDGTIQAWDLSTHVLSAPITGQTGSIDSVAVFEFNGSPFVIAGSSDGTLQSWNLTTHEQPGDPITGHGGWVNATAVALADGNPVAVTGGTDGTVRVWRLFNEERATGHRRFGHSGPANSVRCVQLADQWVAVTASDDGTVRTWDAKTGESFCGVLRQENGPVKSAARAMIKNRPMVVTGSDAGFVRVTDIYPLARRRYQDLHAPGSVRAAECTHVNNRPVAIAGTKDGQLFAWDVLTGISFDLRPADYIRGVKAMACIHDGDQPTVITVDDDGDLRACSLPDGQPISGPATSEPTAVNAIASCYLDGQPVVVTGSDDGWVRVRDLPYLELVRHKAIGGRPITAIQCCDWDGTPISLTGRSDGTVGVWNMRTDAYETVAMMPRKVNSLDLTADGDLIVCFGWEVASLGRIPPGRRR